MNLKRFKISSKYPRCLSCSWRELSKNSFWQVRLWRNGAMGPLVSNWILSIQDFTGDQNLLQKGQFLLPIEKQEGPRLTLSRLNAHDQAFYSKKAKFTSRPPGPSGEDNQCSRYWHWLRLKEEVSRKVKNYYEEKIISGYTILTGRNNQQVFTATSRLDSNCAK